MKRFHSKRFRSLVLFLVFLFLCVLTLLAFRSALTCGVSITAL
ncbi:MAG: hypothetical protein ACI4PM_06620 [Butyricicoccus sp.]